MIGLQRYGTWALITGAARGLGREFAVQISEEGLNCVLVDIDARALDLLGEQLHRQHDVQIRCLPIDLGRPEATGLLADRIQDLEIGLLINNAGIGCGGAFASRETEQLEKLITLNCLTPVMLTRRLLPGMLERNRGGVVYVSSLQAFISCPYEATYCASKAFKLHFGESLWGELRKTPIDCLTVCPAGMRTGFFEAEGFAQRDCDRVHRYSADPGKIASMALSNLGRRAVVAPASTRAVSLLSRLLPRHMVLRGADKLFRKLIQVERRHIVPDSSKPAA